MTNELRSEHRCTRCGTFLSKQVLGGQCPQCLGRISLMTNGEAGSASPTPDAPLVFMRSFGDYELLEEIARGGMGIVYRARQKSLGRMVALKMLIAGEFASPTFVQRFRKEAEAAAALSHPNIVGIHEIGQHEGQHYFSMELIDGQNLADHVRERPLPAHRAVAYLLPITNAVHFAHQRGILHRDIKPSNVLIDPFDCPRLTDFGLARILGGASDLTLTGQAMGSPAYMAPEHASGQGEATPAGDIYSLGALLYHLVTGRPPFQSDSLPGTLRQVQENDPVPPRRLNPDVPEDLQTICLKCMEKLPSRRYPSAAAVADELRRFLNHESIQARPASAAEKLLRWSRRRPAVAGLSAGVLLLLLTIAMVASLAALRISSARSAEQIQRSSAEAANRDLRASNRQLEQTVSALELRQAEELFGAQDPSLAVAHLARLLRRDPSNHVAANRLMYALVHRDWVFRSAPPVQLISAVETLRFHPKGGQILTVERRNRATVSDPTTSKVFFTLSHQNQISSAQYSRDGARILTASADGTVGIWNSTNGRPVIPHLAHNGVVNWAEFSRDDRWIGTASADRHARIWDSQTGVLKYQIVEDSPVIRLRFNPRRDEFVTLSESGALHLRNLDNGELARELRGHRQRVTDFSFSPNGEMLAVGCDDGNAWVWRVSEPEAPPLLLAHGPVWAHVWHVAFSPDSQFILTTGEDGVGSVWNATTGIRRPNRIRHEGGIVFGEFSPDGDWIVTASSDASARVWHFDHGDFAQPLRHRERVRWAAFSPEGRRLATGGVDATLQVWDFPWRQLPPRAIRAGPSATSVAFRTGDSTLFTTSKSQTARLWNRDYGHPAGPEMTHPTAVICSDLSRDGRWAVTGCEGGSAHLWDLASSQPGAGSVYHTNSVRSVQFSPNGEWFATGSADTSARVWNTKTGEPVSPVLQHSGRVVMVRFSPDGQYLATASEDQTARVWNALTGESVAGPLRHGDQIASVDIDPNSQKLVTASGDNTACIWDLRTGKLAAPPLQHPRAVAIAVFTLDGQRIVTGSQDRSARVWDANTGQALTPPMRHTSTVSQLSLSPDGRRLLTGGWNGFVRYWDLDTGLPMSEWRGTDKNCFSLDISSTGGQIAVGTVSGSAFVWDMPNAPVPVPDWFPEFVEAVAGLRLSDRGSVELISRSKLEFFRQRFASTSEFGFYERLSRWFLGDPTEREWSPFGREE